MGHINRGQWTATRLAGRHHQIWVVIIGLLLAAAISLLAVKEAGDDAYIVFRYVVRWLHGRGLTFNDGEFVEGFTSVTWTVLHAGLSRIAELDVAVTAIVLNVIILLVTVVVLDRALHVDGTSPTARAITVCAFSTFYVYFRVCFFGLELGLFGLLLTVFCGVICRLVPKPHGNGGRGPIWAALGGIPLTASAGLPAGRSSATPRAQTRRHKKSPTRFFDPCRASE